MLRLVCSFLCLLRKDSKSWCTVCRNVFTPSRDYFVTFSIMVTRSLTIAVSSALSYPPFLESRFNL